MTGIGLVLPRPGGSGIPITLPFSDNFNRADNATALGKGWTAAAITGSVAFGISGNKAYCPTASSSAYAVREYGAADVDMSVKIAGSSAVGHGLCVRYVNTNNTLYLWFDPGNNRLALNKLVGGADSALASAAPAVPGDTVRVLALGTSVKVFVNGTQRISVSDTTYAAATQHGLFCGYGGAPAATQAWDDFTIASSAT